MFATEAMRTAENRDEMLAAIKKASGLTVDILSPGMESLFGAMGARSGYTAVDGLFMDLGGGSVQMTYVNSEREDGYDVLAAGAARSLPFGAAKLTLALSVDGELQLPKKADTGPWYLDTTGFMASKHLPKPASNLPGPAQSTELC